MLTIVFIFLRIALINLLFGVVLFLLTNNILLSVLISVIVVWGVWFSLKPFLLYYHRIKYNKIAQKYTQKVKTLTQDGFTFRDLNKNGKLDPYEDSRLDVETRVNDLLSQMNVQEKAGLLFNHFTFFNNPENTITEQDFTYDTYPQKMIYCKNMNTFTIFGGGCTPKQTAVLTNALQEMAEKTRLGIPATIASDPRHHYDAGVGAGAAQNGISRWPEQLGLAATRDNEITRNCGRIVAKEFRAQGMHIILGPMADMATSPMWGRNYGTFGDDKQLVSEMVSNFIIGCQEDKKENDRHILCQVKHFPGGGSQKDGWDSHFPYGKEQIYPTNGFNEHLAPFEKAIDDGVSQIMPYYSIPEGLSGIEEVGFNFNKKIITDLLRNKLGFDGVIGTDFSIIKGTKYLGFSLFFPKVWGVEKLKPIQRLKKAFDAGVDQIGGETCSELLVQLIENGEISMERIDESCKRVLRDKFKMGLFDNPYIDAEKAEEICGCKEHMQAGEKAQQNSLILLKNGKENGILPLKKGVKVYCENISDNIKKYATVVNSPQEADIAIIRRAAPHIKQYRYLYEGLFKQGRLDFDAKEEQKLIEVMKAVPTIFDIGLDRPAVIENLVNHSEAVTGHFGCEEEVFLAMIFGEFAPTGKLPFSLPKNMEDVYTHKVDAPFPKEKALFAFGHGLTY